MTAVMEKIDHDNYDDEYIRRILRKVNVIAMAGASANWNRPSYFAMKYLQQKGYRVIPVNPKEAGKEILGEKVYASISEIPVKVDMVDCFRNSDAIPPLADEAIKVGAKVLWMQLGVQSPEARRIAEAAGLEVVENRCVKIEHARLFGGLGWAGVNTKVISSKRPAA